MKLVTIANLEGYYYKPRMDKEILRKYAGGIIAFIWLSGRRIVADGNAGRYEKADEAGARVPGYFRQGKLFYRNSAPSVGRK